MPHPFYIIPDAEKAQIIQQAGNITGQPAYAIEKDWWVVQTLSMIFSMELAGDLVFKGGTSLSKGWKLIERFSEDVDLAIDRKRFGFEGPLDKNALDKLRRASGAFVDTTFMEQLQHQLDDRGFDRVRIEVEPGKRSDRDRTVLLHYPYVVPYPAYILPRVKIEFSCRSLMEPASARSFSSILDEAFPEAKFVDASITVATVNPERTFLEKIFLLHEEFQRPVEKMRSGDRLSRHLYDVVQLSKTEFADTALASPELYQTIVAHRSQFNAVPGVDYSRHAPKYIQPVPPEAIIAAWKADYAVMLEQMINEQNAPDFDTLIIYLQELTNKINNLSWTI